MVKKIMAELPIHTWDSIQRSLDFLTLNEKNFDEFLITDLPFNNITVDALGLIPSINKLIDNGRVVFTVSVGHRDLVANLSRIYGLSYMGIKRVFIVQGDDKLSLSSQIFEKLSSKNLRLGIPIPPLDKQRTPAFKKKTKKVSFLISQLYPSFDVIRNLVPKLETEIYLSYPIFSKELTAKNLESYGITVPLEIKESSKKDEASIKYIISELKTFQKLFNKDFSLYLIPLARNFDYSKVKSLFGID